MHYRILSNDRKQEILSAFGLAYVPRPFDEEVIPEGRSDTKFRFLTESRNGHKDEIVLTIYETPDVHINGRDPFYAEVSTLYAAHVAKALVGMQDRVGNAIYAAVATPYMTADGTSPFIRRDFDGVSKVITLTPFILKAKEGMGADDAEEAGRALAAMHRATDDFTGITLPNNFGPGHLIPAFKAFDARRENTVVKLTGALGMSAPQAELFLDRTGSLLDKILTKWNGVSPTLTPGWINGDYFPDNTLLSRDGKLVTIDLGMVCQDTLLYDLAIGMNAWSFSGPDCNRTAAAAFLAGYNSVREITPPELEALPVAAAVAGLRWTMSRLGKVVTDLPTRSPVDSLNQARFWEIFIDQGQRMDLSATATISDRVSRIGQTPD